MIAKAQNSNLFEKTIDPTCSLLIFHLAGQAFALNIEVVTQIIPMLRLTPVPQRGELIEGVFNLHGKIVPVASLRRHLGLPELEPDLYTPIILTLLGEQPVGWIVDQVTDVIDLPAESLFSPSDILPEWLKYSQIISGLFYQQEQPVLLLDPACILHSAQLRKIIKAINERQPADQTGQDYTAITDRPESEDTTHSDEAPGKKHKPSKRGKRSGT